MNQVFEYDRAGRLARQRVKARQHETQVAYDYDPSGNLVARRDSRLGEDRYRYDPLGRIIAHTNPAGHLQHFAYDAQGDRFRVVREDRQGRHLDHAEGGRWRLDAAGQLVERYDASLGVQHFEWDAFGRLVNFESTTNAWWTYRYDALGRRIGKELMGQRCGDTVVEHRGARTRFLWDGDVMVGEHREERMSSDRANVARGRYYVYHQDSFEPLAMQAWGADAGDELYSYENEPNGAPVRLRDAEGSVVWEAHYNVTGKVDYLEAKRVEQPIRLQGQYYDVESKLHYNRFRYFDPNTGSFISPDPIGLAGGLNPFQFAPNIFGWTDPLGLRCKTKRQRARLKKIRGLSNKPGNSQITGRVTRSEARELAEEFVGPGFSETATDKGVWVLKSEDGLRKVRGPSFKPTDQGRNVHPVSKQPFSATGKQMNFETRQIPSGAPMSNVHLDVGE